MRHTYRDRDQSMTSPSTYRAYFGDDDTMEVDSPTQSLRRLLAEKTKENQATKESGAKRTWGKTSPNQPLNQTPQRRLHVNSTVPERRLRQNLWLGFSNMVKLALEEGLEELFNSESNEDKVLRWVSKKETKEMEEVAVSFPTIPHVYYPGKQNNGVPVQYLNIT